MPDASGSFDLLKALEGVPDEMPQGSAVSGDDGGGFDLLKALESVPDVETTPLEAPQPTPEVIDPNMVFVGSAPVSPIITNAAKAGVQFDAPAPSGHFLGSLAIDQDRRAKAFKAELSQKFGQDIDVRVGPKTGELEYFNPKTDRYSLVSPPGTFQVGALGGPAIVFGPELAAGLSTALLTKSPAAVIAAESGGAFFGEIARLSLGKSLGANEDVTDNEIIMSALKEAGISAAGGAAGTAMVKAGRFVLDIIQGRAFNREALKGLDLTMEEAQQIADQINEKIGSARMKFTLGQATNEEDILRQEEFFRKNNAYAREFRQFDEEQSAALREYASEINKPYSFPITKSEFGLRRKTEAEVGGDAMGVAQSAVQREKDKVDVFVRMKNSELDDAIVGIKDRPYEDLGQAVRSFGDEEQSAFTGSAAAKAKALNDLAGNKEFVQNSNLYEVVKSIDETISDALFPSVQKPQRSLIGAAREAVDENGDIVAIGNKIFDPAAKFTFKQAWDAISALKRLERVAAKGLSTETPDVAAIGRLYRAMEKDLRASAQSSPLREQYDQFINWYRAEKTRLDKGVVGQIMEREGKNGRFQIADERVFKSFFTKGTKREATELFNLVKNNPELMQGVRESVGDFYKREVMEGGRVNINKHAQFIKDYNKPLSVFFTKDEMRTLMRPGHIEQALRAREVAKDEAVVQINKSFEADIANLNNPGKLVSLIMDPTDPSKAGRLMEMLDKTPDVKRGVQAAFLKRMADQVAGAYEGKYRNMSPARLNDFLNGKGAQGGHKGVVRAVFGEQYVNDLETLNDALQIAARENTSPNRSNTGAFLFNTVKGLARAYVGIFTRAGRMITAASALRSKAAERVMFRALMNPGDLRALMDASSSNASDRFAALVSGMGGSILMEDFNE